MNADHAAGTVVVDDNLVQFRGVHGRFAGGDIATDADLDFRKPDWVLTFSTVSVDKIVWHELPKPWVEALLPEFLKDYKPDGVFKGTAHRHSRLRSKTTRSTSPGPARARSTM